MEATKVYIYALLNDSKIVYIGKSSVPQERLGSHKSHYNNPNLKLKILDFFYDKEIGWLNKFLNEGYDLYNKETLKHTEEWEIGDIIETKIKPQYKILDKESGIVYKSIYSLSKHLKLDQSHLTTRINNPSKYPEFKKYTIL